MSADKDYTTQESQEKNANSSDKINYTALQVFTPKLNLQQLKELI